GNSVPDGVVDSADLNAINDALFSQPGDANYNTYADMNRDNIINGSDKDYATANITSNTGGLGSIRPVFPVFKQAQPQGDNAKAVVTLTGLPESEVRPGETFDVSVKVSGANAVRTYEVHLSFDPTKLAVEDLVSDGDLLQNYLTNMSGKMEQGDLGLVNSILGQTPVGASGEGTLATVRFRAISRASETKLMLGDAMLIDVQHTGFTPQVDGGGTIVLSNDPMVYHDADGAEIKGLILATADAKVDFNDFLVLARAFGTDASSPNFDLRADLNADDQVSFADFVLFSKDFGKEAVDAPASARASKPVTEGGVNSAAAASLNLKGAARMGEPVTLTVDLSDAKAVQGWGLTVQYDAELFEFVSANAPEAGLLTAAGTDAPLFLVHQDKEGEVTLAHALNAGQTAVGEGSIAVLTFQPKGDFEDSRFEVFNGIVFDANDLPNQVFAGDALQVRMAPAQFALGQNYPNPFNPETTISYDLADASRVKLEIYNVMGQLVNTLVSEEQAAGRYRVVWNGSDAHQRQVASGVYFYRIQTEAFKAVRKLMLLK
ncbi:MAG: cohesin domain-containing protein, partial [bacterium]|nr:cohesin domain-containing protein [bacterium]